MRGIVVNELKHHSQIPLSKNVPIPKPGKNEVLCDVYSAAMNFFDVLQTQGKYQNKPPLPFILGCEFAGRIAEDSPIPPGCPFKPGDRVFGAGQGSYAEKMAVNFDALLPIPKELSYEQAAGLYITWPTSYEGLVGRANLKTGDTVLVTAAAGGVGIAAVQLAKALGATVIAAAGSAAKLDIAKRCGADFTVDYTKAGWQQDVLKMTKGKGVDIVYDPVGTITDSLKCIAWKGRAVVVGFAAGNIEKVPMNLVLLKNVSIVGLHWGAYRLKEPGHTPEVWKGLLDLLSSGKVQPVVYSKVYSLDTVMEGLTALEKRETWGKVIVSVQGDSKAKL
ncbi:hypothetical protein VKT23_000698 [Stygiomarasmius scandens]|uniref:Enoyl reductase (ER) domain-containing protein n=1 Tax=Marasmiellus scandens TaxID=2682957 RepID=A0ABR1K7A7_9AGAR